MCKKVCRICADAQTACQISGCDSGEEVLLQEESPDILFLDIQMPGRNGMEIAGELRRKNHDTILIFVTALSEYVYEAFDVDAFHYLVKPFGDDKLREVLVKALRQYEEQQRNVSLRRSECARTGMEERKAESRMRNPAAILVKRGGISTKVLLEDIIYAEVFNRKVMLHTTGGDIEYYGKLTDLSEQAGENFYRTHRAYLVNFRYVEKYDADTVWLERGKALISKKQYAGFVRQYMKYLNRKRGG
ncbi:MAG: LytTR family DNA-binding domain-containing protein [Eubacterium sp.]|nr:LytTR family DNA-binding domain-containing protein [Eubacterium sp.]